MSSSPKHITTTPDPSSGLDAGKLDQFPNLSTNDLELLQAIARKRGVNAVSSEATHQAFETRKRLDRVIQSVNDFLSDGINSVTGNMIRRGADASEMKGLFEKANEKVFEGSQKSDRNLVQVLLKLRDQLSLQRFAQEQLLSEGKVEEANKATSRIESGAKRLLQSGPSDHRSFDLRSLEENIIPELKKAYDTSMQKEADLKSAVGVASKIADGVANLGPAALVVDFGNQLQAIGLGKQKEFDWTRMAVMTVLAASGMLGEKIPEVGEALSVLKDPKVRQAVGNELRELTSLLRQNEKSLREAVKGNSKEAFAAFSEQIQQTARRLADSLGIREDAFAGAAGNSPRFEVQMPDRSPMKMAGSREPSGSSNARDIFRRIADLVGKSPADSASVTENIQNRISQLKPGEAVTFGRTDFGAENANISREHLTVMRVGDKYRIIDGAGSEVKPSRHGIKYSTGDGWQDVQGKVVLNQGERIKISGMSGEFDITLPEPESPLAPTKAASFRAGASGPDDPITIGMHHMKPNSMGVIGEDIGPPLTGPVAASKPRVGVALQENGKYLVRDGGPDGISATKNGVSYLDEQGHWRRVEGEIELAPGQKVRINGVKKDEFIEFELPSKEIADRRVAQYDDGDAVNIYFPIQHGKPASTTVQLADGGSMTFGYKKPAPGNFATDFHFEVRDAQTKLVHQQGPIRSWNDITGNKHLSALLPPDWQKLIPAELKGLLPLQ